MQNKIIYHKKNPLKRYIRVIRKKFAFNANDQQNVYSLYHILCDLILLLPKYANVDFIFSTFWFYNANLNTEQVKLYEQIIFVFINLDTKRKIQQNQKN